MLTFTGRIKEWILWVAATVRNLGVAELVNIYEVFLLCWPLAERVGEKCASESFKKLVVTYQSWLRFQILNLEKNSLFTKNVKCIGKTFKSLKLKFHSRYSSPFDGKNVRYLQSGKSWLYPASLLCVHALHSILWVMQEDPLGPHWGRVRDALKPVSVHPLNEEYFWDWGWMSPSCALSGAPLPHLITLSSSILQLIP